MDRLDLYVSVMDKIDADVYYKMIDVYGRERVDQAMVTGILSMKDTSLDFYQLQLKIWDKFGYYLATLDKNMFADDVKKKAYKGKSKSVTRKSLQEEDLFTLDEEIYYGFHLLKKDYIELFLRDGDYTAIDLYKVSASVKSKETFDQVMERFGYFYRVCSRNSDFDRNFRKILREIREKYCGLKEYDQRGVLGLVANDENRVCEELREDFLLEQVNMYIDYSIACNKFMSSNIRLAEKFAHKLSSVKEYDDLFQESMIGIFNAISSYDIRNKARFSTYAWQAMKNCVYRTLNNTEEIIRVPEYVCFLMSRLRRFGLQFYQEHGRRASMVEMAEMLEMKEDALRRILINNSMVSCSSLDAIIHEGEGWNDDISLLNSIVDPKDDFAASISEYDFEAFMNFMKKTLTPREMEVLLKHAGIGIDSPMTFEQMGDMFNVTRQRVNQISEKAIRKLTRTKKGQSFNPFV